MLEISATWRVRTMRATQKGLSIEGVQGHNRQVILKALHDLGTCSRKDISVMSGLDQATVTRAIGPLVDDGIVEEVGLVKGGRGRRSINLDFSASGGISCACDCKDAASQSPALICVENPSSRKNFRFQGGNPLPRHSPILRRRWSGGSQVSSRLMVSVSRYPDHFLSAMNVSF